jgi:hypothetical protein
MSPVKNQHERPLGTELLQRHRAAAGSYQREVGGRFSYDGRVVLEHDLTMAQKRKG